jgi:hypothetical protein
VPTALFCELGRLGQCWLRRLFPGVLSFTGDPPRGYGPSQGNDRASIAHRFLATALPAVACLSNKKALVQGFFDGRYWARTSDPQLVELVLSQLS